MDEDEILDWLPSPTTTIQRQQQEQLIKQRLERVRGLRTEYRRRRITRRKAGSGEIEMKTIHRGRKLSDAGSQLTDGTQNTESIVEISSEMERLQAMDNGGILRFAFSAGPFRGFIQKLRMRHWFDWLSMKQLIWADLIVNCAFCVLTLVDMEVSYSVPEMPQWYLLSRPYWLWLTFFILTIIASILFIPKLLWWIAGGGRYYVTTWTLGVELLTILPILIAPLLYANGKYLVDPQFLRAFLVVWSLNAFLNHPSSVSKKLVAGLYDKPAFNPVQTPRYNLLTTQLILLSVSLGAFIFVGMCMFHTAEEVASRKQYGIIDSLYFMSITVATVGYGDVVPSSTLSRLVVIILIFGAIMYFPKLISDLIATYKAREEGYRRYKPKAGRPYVVIYLSYSQDQYLYDVLHNALQSLTKKTRIIRSEDATRVHVASYHIVILSRHPLSEEVKSLLDSPVYASRVTYILGSALEERDLRRAGIVGINDKAYLDLLAKKDRKKTHWFFSFLERRNARNLTYTHDVHETTASRYFGNTASLLGPEACFVLANRVMGMSSRVESAIEEDSRNVLRVWSVRKFAPWTPVYAYNLRQETDIHVRPVSREVVCINSIKQLILGFSALHKGAAALITNLIHRAPILYHPAYSWQLAYADGCQNNIFIIPVNPLFIGKSFSSLAWFLYAEFQVILIGLRLRVPAKINMKPATHTENFLDTTNAIFTYQDHIVLNPAGNYIIPSVDIMRDLILISESVEDIIDIERLNAVQLHASWIKWNGLSIPESPPKVDHANNFAFMKNTPPTNVQPTSAEQSSPKLTIDTSGTGKGLFAEEYNSPVSQSGVLFSSEENPSFPALRKPSFLGGPPKSPEIDPGTVYTGHPRPPHHMVLDNDLQSPSCYLLKSPMSMKNVHLVDVTQPADDCHVQLPLSNHIIVCSPTFELFSFICTVRASFIPLEKLRPILVLCPRLPSDEEWDAISVFPAVYFIQGRAMKRNDMVRAGLHGSSCVIMMKHPVSGEGNPLIEEKFSDSAAIMCTHQVDFMVRDKYVVTELVDRQNVKFLRAKHDMLDHLPPIISELPHSTPPIDLTEYYRRFMYRRAAETTELTTPGIIHHHNMETMNQDIVFAHPLITHSGLTMNTEESGYYAYSQIYAAGRVVPGDMFDGLIFESFRTPGIVEVIKLMCGRRFPKWDRINRHLNVTSSILTTIKVPSAFVNDTFSALFRFLTVTHHITPIAVYRRRTVNHKTAETHPELTRTNSPSTKHLFNLSQKKNQNMTESSQSQMLSSEGSTKPTRKQNREAKLHSALDDANRLDNDLPFVVTNPLPDFVLDNLDSIFVLKPQI